MAFGHAEYSLSENDLRMVRSVPPGGNWRNIPESIPSARLDGIRATGGRTTLYGRLRWEAPSYTITTYFNRPGNGCYIHPSEDRVITSLEAARIQSFPDAFVFKGSKTSRTKQIGNAVPPLLAFAIGSSIRAKHPELLKTLDLFSGAGGLTLGLGWAGFRTIAANDFFKEAGQTYSHNNPGVNFIPGDITSEGVQRQILDAVDGADGVDVVVGGPPCQGFSNAGLRMIDDPRNQLYKNFVSIVEATNPKVFVMENVEGILSINKGKTFEEIKSTFIHLGYDVLGKKLIATDFGVPQKRKRVFIIGSRIGSAADLFPESTFSESSHVTTRDAIGDIPLQTSESIDDVVLPQKPSTLYQKLMQGLISPGEFVDRTREFSNRLLG